MVTLCGEMYYDKGWFVPMGRTSESMATQTQTIVICRAVRGGSFCIPTVSRSFVLRIAIVYLLIAVGLAENAIPPCLTLHADEPGYSQSEQTAKIRQMIEDLGDSRYANRQRAVGELVELGSQAVPLLIESHRHPDLEVRIQIRRIVSVIQKRLFLARLDDFVLFGNRYGEADLPGWQEYRQLVGDDRNTRALFVKMQKAEPQLLQSYADRPNRVGDLLWARCEQINRQRNRNLVQRDAITPERVAALLLVAGDPRIATRERCSAYVNSFCYQDQVRRALENGPDQRAFRTLLGTWVRLANQASFYHVFRLAMRYSLNEGLVPAQTVLRTYRQQQTAVVQYAVLTVAKLGSVEHVPWLEPLLNDVTRCATHTVNEVKYQTQLRDVALGCLFVLVGVDPKKMGFSLAEPHAELVYLPKSLGFADEQQRKAAVGKWYAFRQQRLTE